MTHAADQPSFVEVADDRASSDRGPGSPSRSPDQPLDRPFAFALVTARRRRRAAAARRRRRLARRRRDRHARPGPLGRGDASAPSRDIAWFEPADGLSRLAATRDLNHRGQRRHRHHQPGPARLRYAASPEESKFFRGLAEGKLLGQRCPKCQKVYVPPRAPARSTACRPPRRWSCPTRHRDDLLHRQRAVPRPADPDPPYVSAYVLLDGADIAFLHLILGRRGRGRPDGHAGRGGLEAPRGVGHRRSRTSSTSAPTGEPDADYETYKQHL